MARHLPIPSTANSKRFFSPDSAFRKGRGVFCGRDDRFSGKNLRALVLKPWRLLQQALECSAGTLPAVPRAPRPRHDQPHSKKSCGHGRSSTRHATRPASQLALFTRAPPIPPAPTRPRYSSSPRCRTYVLFQFHAQLGCTLKDVVAIHAARECLVLHFFRTSRLPLRKAISPVSRARRR